MSTMSWANWDALDAAETLLNDGGRLIDFHSLEDNW